MLAITGGRTARQLTAAQVKNPPVGSGAAVFAPFGMRLSRPWVVLVMSDGVWKYVGWDRVVQIPVRERGPALVDELQRVARLERSGRFQDDFTVVVLEGQA